MADSQRGVSSPRARAPAPFTIESCQRKLARAFYIGSCRYSRLFESGRVYPAKLHSSREIAYHLSHYATARTIPPIPRHLQPPFWGRRSDDLVTAAQQGSFNARNEALLPHNCDVLVVELSAARYATVEAAAGDEGEHDSVPIVHHYAVREPLIDARTGAAVTVRAVDLTATDMMADLERLWGAARAAGVHRLVLIPRTTLAAASSALPLEARLRARAAAKMFAATHAPAVTVCVIDRAFPNDGRDETLESIHEAAETVPYHLRPHAAALVNAHVEAHVHGAVVEARDLAGRGYRRR